MILYLFNKIILTSKINLIQILGINTNIVLTPP